ncbi:guanylyltransferase TglT toxin [Frankia sp. AiPs1]|uniref:nucleotidyl transferase AbiEii/AbiGii toxin family protein n=1 Tax=Frankia sp. AiPa1 TaxID=573492 RepID=UPI00202B659D|nr:nucleotidyl transferase AbiEii/AbiGii toxin family protein [Frankia sp. AiPa1]MCL9763029.1 nucleotidyl transferase AbiEii/AbiGii toxin family protein [Frankia sp. AiPa1]
MTQGSPTRATADGRAYLDLRSAARRAGRDTAEYLALYALEGFLARLGASRYAQDLVLKGGVLLAAYAARRPTRDIDLQATRLSNDVEEIVTVARAVAAQPRDDGLTYDLTTIIGRDIRDEDKYAGVRVSITARLATATVPFHLDVNVGDPIWPSPVPVALPLLLGGQTSLLGYPAHMVLAEKIATALERGIVNTRWRDFVDIASIAARTTIIGADLDQALQVVARHRDLALTPLSPALTGFGTYAQPKWRAWRRRQRLEATTPEQFDDLVNTCCALADPVLRGETTHHLWRDGTWQPA